MATSLRSIRERRLLRNYRLVSKIENTMNKFLIGFQHVGPHSPILSYPMSPYPMSCTVILHVSVLSYPHAPILYVSVLSCPRVSILQSFKLGDPSAEVPASAMAKLKYVYYINHVL